VRQSQIITKLSSEHDANMESSGDHAISITSDPCPLYLAAIVQFSTFGASALPNAAFPGPSRSAYTNTLVSVDPLAKYRPFRENRTQFTGPK
jgi:hypothetical protein